jgi:hypothetical protein
MLDWIGVSKHNGDLRVIASAIMGSVGTAYTAIEAVKGFLQGRTSVSKIKEQRAHVTEIINFLERLRRGAQERNAGRFWKAGRNSSSEKFRS